MTKYVSYRFGAGRYIQEQRALDCSGEEILRYGKQAYVISGSNAWEVVRERMTNSFEKTGLLWTEEIYKGFPSYEKIKKCTEIIREKGCDVIVGVGGGKIMDLAKAVADSANIPVVLIPTSAATCAAFSPLSVIYSDEGKCEGLLHFDYEVNSVIVDEDIMASQPPKLLAAGIMDAMAKYIEIANGKSEITLETDSVEKFSAYALAGQVYRILERYGKQAYCDVEQKRMTKELHNIVFCSIALTGIVSGLMRAKGQATLAHRLYEVLRTYYFRECTEYLHGEIVATGLLAQLKFNQNEKAILGLKSFMKKMDMPMCLQELGVSCDEEIIADLYHKLCATESVQDTKEEQDRLWEALKEIY